MQLRLQMGSPAAAQSQLCREKNLFDLSTAAAAAAAAAPTFVIFNPSACIFNRACRFNHPMVMVGNGHLLLRSMHQKIISWLALSCWKPILIYTYILTHRKWDTFLVISIPKPAELNEEMVSEDFGCRKGLWWIMRSLGLAGGAGILAEPL